MAIFRRSSSTTITIFFLFNFNCFDLNGQSDCNYQAKLIPIESFAANHSISALYQDSIGVLWIGTYEGLYVYDGNSTEKIDFDNSALKEKSIINITEDEQQRLWVYTMSGVMILNKTRDALVTPYDSGLPQWLFNNPDISICGGLDKSIFVISGGQIYLFQYNRLHEWAVTKQYSLHLQGSLAHYDSKSESIIVESKNNDTYVISKYGTYSRIQGGQPLVVSQISHDSIIAHKDNPKFKTIFLYYDRMKRDFMPLQSQKHLEDRYILPIKKLLEQNNDLETEQLGSWYILPIKHKSWVVSCSKGLFILSPVCTLFHSIPPSYKQRIRGITTDCYNNVIYGTYNGLYWYNATNGSSGLITNDSTTIWGITATNKERNHFIAVGEGWRKKVFYLQSSPSGVRLVKTQKASEHDYSKIFSIVEDNKGRGLWYSESNEERSYMNLVNLPSLSEKKFDLSSDILDIRTIAQTDKIWLGSHLGLWVADVNDLSGTNLRTSKDGIPLVLQSAHIHALYADKAGSLWIGTRNNGVFHYKQNPASFIQYTVNDGLSDNTIFSIVSSPDSVLWIGTGKGLSRFDTNKKHFDNYYTTEGLLSNEFNTGAIHISSDGTVYMGGQNGINFFKSENITASIKPSGQYLVVSSSNRSGKFGVAKTYLTNQATIIVEPDNALLSISFRSGALSNSSKIHFRYRLTNLSSEWEYINYADKAIFTGLPVGHHTLEVQLMSLKGLWEDTSTYYISVIPPWYSTWWFRTFVILALVIILYNLYRLRLRQLRREFDLRQQISHDLHDSLGSRIYLLRSLSNQITNPLANEKEKKAQLERFEAISQDTFKSIRDFIWAFDPKQDELKYLFDRMDDFAENYLSPLVSVVNIKRLQQEERIKIAPRLKHHLINIYQEILTNIVKHTYTEAIEISLGGEGKKVTISIKNKHKGYKNKIPLAENAHKMGQDNIRHRLAEIEGILEWEEPNQYEQVIIIETPVNSLKNQ